jgi:hypothetical protein
MTRQEAVAAATRRTVFGHLSDFVLGGGGIVLAFALWVWRLDWSLIAVGAALLGYGQGILASRTRGFAEAVARFGPVVEGGFGEPPVLLADRPLAEHDAGNGPSPSP